MFVARAAKVPCLSSNDLICIKTLSFDFRGKRSLPLLLRAQGVCIHSTEGGVALFAGVEISQD